MWWKIIPWTFKMHFGEGSHFFSGNVPAFIAQNLKKTKELFFWTTLFTSKCSFELIDQNFGIPADFVCRNFKICCSKSKILQQNTSLFERFFSFKTILSAQRKPFPQTFQKTSAKKVGNWQNGSSNISKCDKIWSPGYVFSSLEKAVKSFMGNFPGFFAQSLKQTKDCFFFTKLFIFRKVSFLLKFLPKT